MSLLKTMVVGIPFKRFHRLVLNLLGVYDNIIATYKIINGSSTVCPMMVAFDDCHRTIAGI